MKYLKQFMIILVISFAGEILKAVLPLPVPASIYGMLIMFTCLITGVVKLSAVRDAGRFMIEIMPVMFIPAGVGLMTSWGVLSSVAVPIAVITVVTIVTVMIVTGHVTQIVVRKTGRED